MLKQLLREHRYELIAFFTGAAVMMLEVVGARLIAPHFGLSTYVWTAMIGVILGALAVGYWLGGVLADRSDPRLLLGRLLISAGVLVVGIGLIQASLLDVIADFGFDQRLGAFLAAVMLFAPASLLIGAVSPNLAKIRIQSLETSGRSVGRLEAAGALGSIAGTFLCGYFLLGYFGSRSLVIGIAIMLVMTSFLAAPRGMTLLRSLVIAITLLLVPSALTNPSNVIADIDTSYARYQVTKGILSGQLATLLITDSHGIQSAINVNNPSDPILTYVRRFADSAIIFGETRSVLVIGGGAYTFPSILVDNTEDTTVDVVEIDGRLLPLARQHFYVSSSPRLRVINEDGRTYLNTAKADYDMIFVDAFSSTTPPFQLTTVEAVEHMKRLLRPGGVVVVNVIDQGPAYSFLASLRATYAKSFTDVQTFQASYSELNPVLRQNFILYAGTDASSVQRMTRMYSEALNPSPPGQPLTDDFAPVEQLTRRPL